MSDANAQVGVLGVDGIRGGWVGVLRTGTGQVQWLVVDHVTHLLELLHRGVAATMAIDIPIGLSDGPPRGCDREARARLPGRASTVFPAPTRASVNDWIDGMSHVHAVSRARSRRQPAPSRQTWNIMPKVVEVDGALPTAGSEAVVECHPEVSFAAMDGRVSARKKSTAGVAQRLRALSGWCDPLEPLTRAPSRVPLVDALDALACAWTAERHHKGRSVPLGDPDARDARGRSMLIWV